MTIILCVFIVFGIVFKCKAWFFVTAYLITFRTLFTVHPSIYLRETLFLILYASLTHLDTWLLRNRFRKRSWTWRGIFCCLIFLKIRNVRSAELIVYFRNRVLYGCDGYVITGQKVYMELNVKTVSMYSFIFDCTSSPVYRCDISIYSLC